MSLLLSRSYCTVCVCVCVCVRACYAAGSLYNYKRIHKSVNCVRVIYGS